MSGWQSRRILTFEIQIITANNGVFCKITAIIAVTHGYICRGPEVPALAGPYIADNRAGALVMPLCARAKRQKQIKVITGRVKANK
jgi:hypothetical protein